MRRVVGRGRGRPRLKRKVDWIVGAVGSAVDQSGVGVNFTSLIDTSDLDDHQDNFTIRRIVGDFAIRTRITGGNSRGCLYWGIWKSEVDTLGNILGQSPFSGVAADMSDWLQRGTVYGPSFVSKEGGSGGPPPNPGNFVYWRVNIDTRVMRKMQGRHNLTLSTLFVDTVDIDIASVDEFFNLRTLVSLS